VNCEPAGRAKAVLIDHICREGATQMAIDQAMLAATVQDGVGRCRLYSWSTPTVSLGYFQEYDDFFAQYRQLSDLPVVRRLTGGGGIIHDREITYCLTLPCDHWLYRAGVVAGYQAVHRAIIDLAGRYGAQLAFGRRIQPTGRTREEPFCFARNYRTDLRSSLGKVVGSAQRRVARAMLQHGSILLENRFDHQPGVGLKCLVNKELQADTFRGELTELLGDRLGLQWRCRTLSQIESALASDFRAELYTTDQWVRSGRKAVNRPARPARTKSC